jgi:hypothetical protein
MWWLGLPLPSRHVEQVGDCLDDGVCVAGCNGAVPGAGQGPQTVRPGRPHAEGEFPRQLKPEQNRQLRVTTNTA